MNEENAWDHKVDTGHCYGCGASRESFSEKVREAIRKMKQEKLQGSLK